MIDETIHIDARSVARLRRRTARRRLWGSYRSQGVGVVGLVMLAVFVAVALVGPLLVPASQIDITSPPGLPFQAPSAAFPLGTDNFGRSVFALIVHGARISLYVGFAATLVATLFGATVGIVSGYLGGRIGGLLNALTNWFLVVPWIALAVLMAAVLGASLLNIILVIAITSWATTARLVRVQTMSVKHRPYVERSRALGAGGLHIVVRHILPNVFPLIFANIVLTVALSILSETTLALIGLGDPNTLSWGRIIYESFEAGALTAGYWWWLIPPGVMIMLVVLSFTLCGMAFDLILNPRMADR